MTIFCVMCRKPIPEVRAIRGSYTCEQACHNEYRKQRRAEIAKRSCRLCGHNHTPQIRELLAFGDECWYCGNPTGDKGQVEHQHPRIQGGTDDPGNLVLACKYCNAQKGGRTVEQYREYLFKNTGEQVIFYGESQSVITGDINYGNNITR
jgi:5-methylcytosine-specific restriction endonuclease McrA